ncbi:MAG: hypothetical protein C0631_05835, partial [Sedimenticola sp.]
LQLQQQEIYRQNGEIYRKNLSSTFFRFQLNSYKILLFLGFLLVSGSAFSQGWNVGWGAHAVPLSPWLVALISVALSVLTFYVMRKKAGQGIAAAVAVFVMSNLLFDFAPSYARLDPDFEITTPSGSTTLHCGEVQQLSIGTTVAGGIVLSTLSPFDGAPPLSGAEGECVVGMTLTTDCSLPCPDLSE